MEQKFFTQKDSRFSLPLKKKVFSRKILCNKNHETLFLQYTKNVSLDAIILCNLSYSGIIFHHHHCWLKETISWVEKHTERDCAIRWREVINIISGIRRECNLWKMKHFIYGMIIFWYDDDRQKTGKWMILKSVNFLLFRVVKIAIFQKVTTFVYKIMSHTELKCSTDYLSQ